MQSNGGGAATNSGIDFQQRIAAYLVLSMGLSLDISRTLDRSEGLKLHAVAFETDDCVDDIVLFHDDCKTYLQAKRKLSLSEQPDSDFYKTIEQIVLGFRNSKNNEDMLIIATSIDSSNKILQDLRKIFESARLNKVGSVTNPLSASETDSLAKLQSCVDKITAAHTLNSFSSDEFQRLIRRMAVITFDVTAGGQLEKAFLISIACLLNVQPELVWRTFISYALQWSKNRQSVDRKTTVKLLADFVKNKPAENTPSSVSLWSFDPKKYDISSGREIILMSSFLPEYDIGLVAFYRFDESGNKRIKIYDTHVELANGAQYKIHARFATYEGAIRFLKTSEFLSEKKLFVGDINSNEDFDAMPFAITYSEKIRNQILANAESVCIHCGFGVHDAALLIEVDEIGLPSDAGIIHQDCLRPSDRILGISKMADNETHPELRGFDHRKWLDCLPGSQALWMGSADISTLKQVVWNAENAKEKKGTFCIRATLEDGSQRYLLERSKVQRFSESKAVTTLEMMNHYLNDAQKEGNPLSYSKDGNLFGRRHDLEEKIPYPQEFVEIKKYSIVNYTRGISLKYDMAKEFYAPLISFVNRNDEEIVQFSKQIFLLTDPLSIKLYIKNWSTRGYELPDYRVDIIPSDDVFDDLMFRCEDENISVLVNPWFNTKKELTKGYHFISMSDLNTSSSSLLVVFSNLDGSFSHIFRDFKNDITLLLSDDCHNEDCQCPGCRLLQDESDRMGDAGVARQILLEGIIAFEIITPREWSADILAAQSVDWKPWQQKIIGEEQD
ncbi:hypothetical protein HC231_20870 [Brenneria izadpanahii]|uniref:Uncharacterized protein n=1 Tax=Brenneria izadpanahii TaxID=2722756 RepID=A0ABX7V125_9GAMM|nr:hypothetical protein [Brenneria izadpanahii]QTF10100.1 hypothetical protein HC231_20870 [Brenneria izadpanahii]